MSGPAWANVWINIRGANIDVAFLSVLLDQLSHQVIDVLFDGQFVGRKSRTVIQSVDASAGVMGFSMSSCSSWTPATARMR